MFDRIPVKCPKCESYLTSDHIQNYTKCPYCDTISDTKKMIALFESEYEERTLFDEDDFDWDELDEDDEDYEDIFEEDDEDDDESSFDDIQWASLSDLDFEDYFSIEDDEEYRYDYYEVEILNNPRTREN